MTPILLKDPFSPCIDKLVKSKVSKHFSDHWKDSIQYTSHLNLLPLASCFIVLSQFEWRLVGKLLLNTAWKVSVFGVIQVHPFPHSDCIRRITPPYSVRMRKNTDQNNCEYGHFLRIYVKHKEMLFMFTTVTVIAQSMYYYLSKKQVLIF